MPPKNLMNRRRFLSLSAVAAASVLFPNFSWASDLPDDIKITRIIGFDMISRRPKFIGKNSQRDDHGDKGWDQMVRLFTNKEGLEGIGSYRSYDNLETQKNKLSALLGKSPFDYFKPPKPAFESPVGSCTMPLWDLAGKVLKKPVYKLLGGKGPKRVPVYDGTIYFADLLPQYADKPLERFKEEIDMGLSRGHRAFKIKIGRGAKWMPPQEGFERDKAVLQTIRSHAGPKIILGIDANNGYTLDLAKQLLTDLPDLKPAFVEEMFPENIDRYLELKAFLKQQKLKSLIADGESVGDISAFEPFMKARAIDIYESDMNRLGIEGILNLAKLARCNDQFVAPHNWGSLVGWYMQLHVARAITNFYRAETDMLDSDILIADGYKIKDGLACVPDSPGFGLKFDEIKFSSAIKPKFDMKI